MFFGTAARTYGLVVRRVEGYLLFRFPIGLLVLRMASFWFISWPFYYVCT